MKKVTAFMFLCFMTFASSLSFAANVNQDKKTNENSSTRSDAVIFKVHDIVPVTEDGVISRCDFTVTLYNRTNINFRSFTLNLEWKDSVDENFKFDQYVMSYISKDEFAEFKDIVEKDKDSADVLKTQIVVNAFGADKQVSIKSSVNNEKCYLMLSDADFTVSPCETVRTTTLKSLEDLNKGKEECSGFFQLVNTSNPEYFGKFKNISASDEKEQEMESQKNALQSIDELINKVAKNMETATNALTSTK